MADLPERLQQSLAGRYQLERQLGRGGMAAVYLAHDLKHDREVALKVLHPELATSLGPERFQREIRTTARLQHPHILPVLDSGNDVGQLWYTMPYVRGESIRDRLRREGQLPVGAAIELTKQIALALDYAHRQGVIHRDLKPENILLADNQALVADFGVAKAVNAAGAAQLTETGLALGTPAYMSPEQATAGTVDHRSDIYALGCVLYEMLAGEPPFTGPTPQAVIAKRVLEPVPHVRTLRDTVPEVVEQALMRALAKSPADRFDTAGEFAGRLSIPATHPTPTPATHPTLRTGQRPRRSLPLVVAALVLAAAVVVGWLTRRRPPTALDANLLAIAPFDVLDPRLQLWHEGLVDLLARNLDGAGPLRTVSPTTVVRKWQGRADRSYATTLARQTGAGLAVYGALVPAGLDSVRLTATVVDAERGRVLAQADAPGPADHVDLLADSLTVRLLAELGESRQIGAVRLTGLRTRSVAALRAFLTGEQFFRQTQWDSAQANYERAVELDTAFALAYWRLGTIRGWVFGSHDSLGVAYSLKAAALNRGLPPRESLLLTCDSLQGKLREGILLDSAERETLRHLFDVAERLTARYPSDPEAWVALGETRFHYGFGLGVGDAMTLETFERAIRLDSAYAPALIHPIQLALHLDDQSAARRYTMRYLALRPGGQTALAASLTNLLLDPATPRARIERTLDTMPPGVVIDTWLNFFLAPDSAEVALRLVQRLQGRTSEEVRWYTNPVVRQGVIATALGFRGHLKEAAQVVLAQPGLDEFPIFLELAMAGALPADTVNSLLRRRLEKQPFWSPPRTPWEEGFLMEPVWWAARRDTLSLKRFMQRVGARTRDGRLAPDTPTNPYWLAAGEAYLALARGDTAATISRLATLPNSTGPVWFERLALARLLAARHRTREALAVLDLEFPDPNPTFSRGLWALERARLAEELGQRDKARYWYGYVAHVWRHGDPELQPQVAEAQEALGRLTSEADR